MADTYTTRLRARKIARDAYTGAWDTPLNQDVIDIYDAAIEGEQTINIGSATSHALVAMVDGTLSDSHHRHLIITGTPASAVAFTIPASVTRKHYKITNNTGQTITVGYASGDTVAVGNGDSPTVYCDGTNVTDVGNGYRITTAESDAGVTPVNYFRNEGDSRRYSTFAEFCAVVAQGVEGHLWSDFSIATPVDMMGGVIVVHGNRTITATATMDYMFKHTSELIFGGEAPIIWAGANNVTYNIFWSFAVMPKLRRHKFKNANGGWSASPTIATYTYGVTGDGILDECEAENCANVGFSARGNATLASQTATLTMINCKTKGTTGSGNYDGAGVGYLAHVSGMRVAVWEGGDFTGHANALFTNGYICSSLRVDGGNYYGNARGPTAGEETQDFVIANTVCKNISGNAVSADTTDGVGETLGVGVISNNVAHSCGRAVRTTCSNVSVTGNKAYECTASGAAFVFAGNGTDVWVDGNADYSATASRVSFYVTENTTVRFGVNDTNSTARTAYQMDSGSLGIWTSPAGTIRTMTTNGDLNASDRIIMLDGTSGTVDLDLFDNTEVKATGFEVLVFKKDATNNCSITFQGGAAHGETVNGATSITLSAANQYRGVRLFCADGAAGTWYATPITFV